MRQVPTSAAERGATADVRRPLLAALVIVVVTLLAPVTLLDVAYVKHEDHFPGTRGIVVGLAQGMFIVLAASSLIALWFQSRKHPQRRAAPVASQIARSIVLGLAGLDFVAAIVSGGGWLVVPFWRLTEMVVRLTGFGGTSSYGATGAVAAGAVAGAVAATALRAAVLRRRRDPELSIIELSRWALRVTIMAVLAVIGVSGLLWTVGNIVHDILVPAVNGAGD